MDEAYDTGTGDGDAPPPHPFFICATPRTGTNLLCDGLASTGLVGVCLEYFNPEHRGTLERRWGCDGSLPSYVRALYGRRTTDAGYLGLKLHWDQVPGLRAESLGTSATEPEFGTSDHFLDRLFPGASYVRVLREDVNRQAVSFWVAHVTDLWTEVDEEAARERGVPAHRYHDPAARPFYSFDGIERCRRAIENGELHWDRFLRANGIEAVTVVYERLVEDFEGTVREVLGHLRPGAVVPEVHPPILRRQSPAVIEGMVERFARDRERRPPPDPAELARAGWERPRDERR